MKKVVLAVLLTLLAAPALATVYEVVTPLPNGYRLTINNDTPFVVNCSISTTMGYYQSFYLNPHHHTFFTFYPNDIYSWNCI